LRFYKNTFLGSETILMTSSISSEPESLGRLVLDEVERRAEVLAGVAGVAHDAVHLECQGSQGRGATRSETIILFGIYYVGTLSRVLWVFTF
jgi:hypothetical protein